MPCYLLPWCVSNLKDQYHMKDSSFRSCSIQLFYFVPATIVAPKAHHPPNDTTHSNHSFGIELCPPIWHHQHLGLSCMCLHKLLPQERYKIKRKKLSLFICQTSALSQHIKQRVWRRYDNKDSRIVKQVIIVVTKWIIHFHLFCSSCCVYVSIVRCTIKDCAEARYKTERHKYSLSIAIISNPTNIGSIGQRRELIR